MKRLDYTGVLEDWKANLIFRRAKRLGFRPDEIDDAHQAVVMDVMAFEFDEAKSNGATEATALTKLIDNLLTKIIRGKNRYRANIERYEKEAPLSYDPVPTMECGADVRSVMEALSPRDRQVCEAVGQGHPITDVAEMLGCTWHTVKRAVARVQKRFRDCDLEPPKKKGKVCRG